MARTSRRKAWCGPGWSSQRDLRAAFRRRCPIPDRALSHCRVGRDYSRVSAASGMHCIPRPAFRPGLRFGEGTSDTRVAYLLFPLLVHTVGSTDFRQQPATFGTIRQHGFPANKPANSRGCDFWQFWQRVSGRVGEWVREGAEK
jgi:hypothetical protein